MLHLGTDAKLRNSLRVVAVGAVISRGHILLLRRRFLPFVGHWGMPGGKVRWGEHPDEAVVREITEECGISTRFRRFCGLLSEKVILPDRVLHYLVLVMKLTTTSRCLSESREGSEHWFPLNRLRAMRREIIPSDRLLLEHWILRCKRRCYFRCEIVFSKNRYHVRSFD